MNSAMHEIINTTPAALLFGDVITLNRGIFKDYSTAITDGTGVHFSSEDVTGDQQSLHSWVKKRKLHQDTLIEVASKLQRKADEAHLLSVSPSEVTVFQENDYVLSLYHRGTMGRRPPSKFLPFWKGPLKVIRRSHNTYVLKDLLTEREESHHVKDLKLFVYDASKVDPMQVAMGDTQDFLIEKIIEHQGDDNGRNKRPLRTNLSFLVKWVGYDDSYNLWQSWKSVLHTEQLRNYLQSKNMVKLLPKDLR
jgi:hypothetical protein